MAALAKHTSPTRTVLVAGLLLVGCRTPRVSLPKPPPDDAVRPVVAVSSFENRSSFQGQWALGEGMADVLVADLVASDHFVVVERRHLERLLDEIDQQRSSYFRPQRRVDLGRLKNVQYFIRGVITDFTQISSASLEAAGEDVGLGFSDHVARVAVTLTIVAVESGEIVDSVSTDGLARAGGAYAKGQYKEIRFGGDAFFRTPLGIATRNAIRKGIRRILETLPDRTWKPRIALVEPDRLVVAGGRDHGHERGMVFEVLGSDEVVTDPATGDRIAVLPGEPVGRVRLVEVRNRIAIAETIEGGPFERGQRLRRVSQESR